MSGMDADASRTQLAAALVRVAGGDRAALRIVYEDTSAKLFGVCLRGWQDLRGAGRPHERAARYDEKLGPARIAKAESLSGAMTDETDHIAPEDEHKLVAAEYVLGVLDMTERHIVARRIERVPAL